MLTSSHCVYILFPLLRFYCKLKLFCNVIEFKVCKSSKYLQYFRCAKKHHQKGTTVVVRCILCVCGKHHHHFDARDLGQAMPQVCANTFLNFPIPTGKLASHSRHLRKSTLSFARSWFYAIPSICSPGEFAFPSVLVESAVWEIGLSPYTRHVEPIPPIGRFQEGGKNRKNRF